MNTKLKHLQIGNLTARLPIIQGGMGVGVSLSKLAGAVAKKAESASFPLPRLVMTRKASRKIRQDVIVLLYGNIFKKQKKSPVATDLSE